MDGQAKPPVTPIQAPIGATAWASAQQHLREVGEPLAVGVEDQQAHRDRRQQQRQRAERGGAGQKDHQRHGEAPPGHRHRQRAGHQLALSGARVERVEAAVQDPVAGHRHRPGRHHRHHDQRQLHPVHRAGLVPHRGAGGDQSERQREHRVLDHHQPQERPDPAGLRPGDGGGRHAVESAIRLVAREHLPRGAELSRCRTPASGAATSSSVAWSSTHGSGQPPSRA